MSNAQSPLCYNNVCFQLSAHHFIFNMALVTSSSSSRHPTMHMPAWCLHPSIGSPNCSLPGRLHLHLQCDQWNPPFLVLLAASNPASSICHVSGPAFHAIWSAGLGIAFKRIFRTSAWSCSLGFSLWSSLGLMKFLSIQMWASWEIICLLICLGLREDCLVNSVVLSMNHMVLREMFDSLCHLNAMWLKISFDFQMRP